MTMGRKDLLVSIGIGAPIDVMHHWGNGDALGRQDLAYVKDLDDMLEKATAYDGGRLAILAIICSHLNLAFEDTGYLYSVDPAGHVERSYYMAGRERDTIMAAME